MDEALSFGLHSIDEGRGLFSASENAAQAAWRESVDYTRQLNLPDTGITPGEMHESFQILDGQVFLNGQPVRSPARFSNPGVYHFENVPEEIRDILQSKYPEGVYIDQFGMPDLTPYSEMNVTIMYTHYRPDDIKAANRAAGLAETLLVTLGIIIKMALL